MRLAIYTTICFVLYFKKILRKGLRKMLRLSLNCIVGLILAIIGYCMFFGLVYTLYGVSNCIPAIFH